MMAHVGSKGLKSAEIRRSPEVISRASEDSNDDKGIASGVESSDND